MADQYEIHRAKQEASSDTSDRPPAVPTCEPIVGTNNNDGRMMQLHLPSPMNATFTAGTFRHFGCWAGIEEDMILPLRHSVSAPSISIPPLLDPFQRSTSTPSAFTAQQQVNRLLSSQHALVMEHTSIEVTEEATVSVDRHFFSNVRVLRRRKRPTVEPTVTIVTGDDMMMHLQEDPNKNDESSSSSNEENRSKPMSQQQPIPKQGTQCSLSTEFSTLNTISDTDREVMALTTRLNHQPTIPAREGASLALDRFFIDRLALSPVEREHAADDGRDEWCYEGVKVQRTTAPMEE